MFCYHLTLDADMAPIRNIVVLLGCLLIATGAIAEEGVIDKTKSAVKHGANWTTTKIEHGAKATGRGLKVGADATGRGLHRAGDATSRAFHKVSSKIGGSSHG